MNDFACVAFAVVATSAVGVLGWKLVVEHDKRISAQELNESRLQAAEALLRVCDDFLSEYGQCGEVGRLVTPDRLSARRISEAIRLYLKKVTK